MQYGSIVARNSMRSRNEMRGLLHYFGTTIFIKKNYVVSLNLLFAYRLSVLSTSSAQITVSLIFFSKQNIVSAVEVTFEKELRISALAP